MRVCCTSDFHGVLPETPECDLLLIAGDVAPDFGRSVAAMKDPENLAIQRQWLEDRFAAWLENRPGDPYVVGIAGNHDFALEHFPDLGPSLPWAYLQDTSYDFEGMRIHGIPWVPVLSRWAFYAPDHILDGLYYQIRNADVVLSHGPPRGFCDLTVPAFGSVHAGAEPALRMLDDVQPLMFVCGHIHEGYGWDFRRAGRAGGVTHQYIPDHAMVPTGRQSFREPRTTLIANVSHMTDEYRPTQPSVLFDVLRDNDGAWRLMSRDLPQTRYPHEPA